MKSKKVHKRFSWLSLSALMMLTAALLSSCFLFSSGGGDDGLSTSTIKELESSFLTTHKILRNEGGTSNSVMPRMLSSQPLTPFSKPAAGGSLVSKATVPVSGSTSGFSNGSLSNYPEPGQTTNWTVTLYDATNKIYKISVTTLYPTTSPAERTVEEYFVKDISPGPGPADNIWNEHDPIVNSAGTQNQTYRIQYYTRFRDGSIRNEKILLMCNRDTDDNGNYLNTYTTWTPEGSSNANNTFAVFDINGSLDYPAVFNPTSSTTATYSSIVLYTHTRTRTLDYWFWKGTSNQNTVGIRYYTEVPNTAGAHLYGTTLVFEKTLDTLLTLGGSLADSLADIYVGGSNDALVRTVTRHAVKFNSSLVATEKTTRSKAVVYDVTGNATLYIEKINDGAASGDLFTDDQVSGSSLNRTAIINNDPYGVPLVTTSPPTGDLGTLYAAIENGALVTTDSKTGGTAYQFNGQQGIVLPDTSGSAYDLTTEGTVEAWVKLFDKVPWAAVVHKGVRDDFADEVYSLQFWSVGNDIAFVLNPSSGNYILVQAGNPYKNLALNTWYYIVATWNTQYIDLYVNGQRVGRKNNTFYTTGTPPPGVKVNDAPVVVGAQFATSSKVYNGYFGLKGIIDNWKVHKEYWDAATVQSKYNNPGS